MPSVADVSCALARYTASAIQASILFRNSHGCCSTRYQDSIRDLENRISVWARTRFKSPAWNRVIQNVETIGTVRTLTSRLRAGSEVSHRRRLEGLLKSLAGEFGKELLEAGGRLRRIGLTYAAASTAQIDRLGRLVQKRLFACRHYPAHKPTDEHWNWQKNKCCH